MKILEIEGHLTNAEVLTYIKNKRTQHAAEDKQKPSFPRPKNFLAALDKHERHLTSSAYPYTKNPSAYSDAEKQEAAFKKFRDLHMERIQVPLAKRYEEMVRNKVIGVKEAQTRLEAEQEKKELSETEWLMIDNHAPVNVEMLQPMVEEWEERFSGEEMGVIVECVGEAYRVDEGEG